jgi:nucleotide-binding universal stress UspA family protein
MRLLIACDGSDCVVVGATGVRGIERVLVGSVSTTAALNAPCSVEIVHRRRAGPAAARR